MSPTARFIIGDALEVLRGLTDASVDLVLTSPPFLLLRSYLPPDHPDKTREMGSESTPGEFLDGLLDVIEECRRVLTPRGSLVVELGDTYAGSRGSGGDYTDTGLRAGQEKFDGSALHMRRSAQRNRYSTRYNREFPRTKERWRSRAGGGQDWPLDKSLVLVPQMLGFALAYGFNPLTGRETPRWRVRNIVRWIRPNPPVGALADKFRPATTEFVVACVDRKRYFDMEAVRLPSSPNSHARTAAGLDARPNILKTSPDGNRDSLAIQHEIVGSPPLDWFDQDSDDWDFPETLKISTERYKGSHYATFPRKLVRPFIEAMCPQKVCTVCGKPSERVTERKYESNRSTNGPQSAARKNADGGSAGFLVRADRKARTLSWTDCGHKSWRLGLVLDPFAGSGVVLAVATGLGRDALGVDLDERNFDLARERVGMFLEGGARAE